MRLVVLLGISYSRLQDILGFLHELTMEINCIVWNSAIRIVFAKYKVRGLLVVLLHLCTMGFAFLRQVVGGSPISALVGLTRLFPRSELDADMRTCITYSVKTSASFPALLSRKVAQAVVFLLRILRLGMIECY